MRPIPILTASTASGKSALALRLAAEFPVEIVAADAFTVYRGLNIGTAKPSAEEQQQVPHHLLDVVDVHETYDVIRFVQAAEQAIGDILSRDAIPLVVGGTGFYLSGLVKGLPLAPPSDPTVREQLEAQLASSGLDALLARVERIRPELLPGLERNPRRVVRNLEVYEQTGRFPVDFGYSSPHFQYQVFGFSWPWSVLEERIQGRTAQMLQAGWPSEAAWLASLVDPSHNPRPTVWQALGYQEALALAQGELDSQQAQERIALATRQYAKRQLTWQKTQLGVTPQPLAACETALREALQNWK